MNAKRTQTNPDIDLITIRPGKEVMTRQELPYFIGISGESTGAKGLSMHLVVIPPGASASPHIHQNFETAIYLLEGKVETRYGNHLEKVSINQAGDFLFIPPGVPHTATNLSPTEPARAIVTRNDSNEQEDVLPYRMTSN